MSEKQPWPRGKKKLLRLILLVLFLAGLYAAGSISGLLDDVDLEWVRTHVEAAGPWSVPVYLGIFCGGVMLWLPGMIFALAGIVIYGPWLGAPLALFGLALSSSISVAMMRGVGGGLLLDTKRPTIQKALDRLDEHPIRSIAILRFFLFVNPPLNAAMAIAGVKFRENFLGTALGMVPATIVMAVGLEFILQMFSSWV